MIFFFEKKFIFKSTTTEMINFRKKLTKEFNNLNNSTQIMKNYDVFTKEITILKEKTNNLAIQVLFFYSKFFISM